MKKNNSKDILKEKNKKSAATRKITVQQKPEVFTSTPTFKSTILSFAKNETTLFPRSRYPVSFRPFLLLQGVVVVLLFAVLYYQGGAISGAVWWFDDLKISFGTAIAPGYITAIINAGNSTGGYKITSGYYQVAAMVETVLGTFLWAGFIATFAKKYMR